MAALCLAITTSGSTAQSVALKSAAPYGKLPHSSEPRDNNGALDALEKLLVLWCGLVATSNNVYTQLQIHLTTQTKKTRTAEKNRQSHNVWPMGGKAVEGVCLLTTLSSAMVNYILAHCTEIEPAWSPEAIFNWHVKGSW